MWKYLKKLSSTFSSWMINMSADDFGIYVHIPFCERKCIYCDFLSFTIRSIEKERVERYFDALFLEIEKKKESVSNTVTSIFIGGGTPSVVEPKLIYSLVEKLEESFVIAGDAEITIEANPGTVKDNDFSVYKDAGINRISFGIQTLNDDLARFLGRIHTREDSITAIKNAQRAGFENINADILIGVPNQSLDVFMSTLNELANLGIPHISAYSLILEEETCLYDMIEKGVVIPPNDDLDRQMYHKCLEYLNSKEYMHYEISNFSLKGYECRHNLLYWNCNEYLGLGLGASSYINSVRFRNTSNFGDYLNGDFSAFDEEVLSEKDKMNEYMLLGFRMTKGPDPVMFYNRFSKYYHVVYKDVLDKLERMGLVKTGNMKGRFISCSLTEKGYDFANQVFMEFV